MKIFIRILMALSLGMVIFNLSQLNWEHPLSAESAVAVIGIMAALCAFLLLLLLMLSKKISKKLNR
jgi:heme A synthase